jgi:ATP-binding cassette, subfamily B, bacterial
MTIASLAWPRHRLSEALALVARAGGLKPSSAAATIPPPASADPAVIAAWLDAAARSLGIEAERTEIPHADLDRSLGAGRLMIIPVEGDLYLALLGNRTILTPAFTRARVSAADLRQAACGPLEDDASQSIAPLLADLNLASGKAARARAALVAERLRNQRITVWTLRQPATAPWPRLLLRPSWIAAATTLAIAHIARLGVWIAAWWLIAATALSGRLDPGWLAAWALLLITLTALHMGTVWLQARLAIGFGALLKQRLLAGALQMEPELLFVSGAGQLLGRVLESEAVETLALAGGFAGAVAIIELAAASAILFAGKAWITALLLLAWIAIAVLLARRYFLEARTWTRTRLDLTHALVERMVGHRTRLAQENPARWHEAEDRELSHYLAVSRERDAAEAALSIWVPRGWLVAGVASLGPVFLAGGSGNTETALAIGFGGLLLAYQAFRRLAAAAWQLIDARVAAEQIQPLLAAASGRIEPQGSPAHASAPSSGGAVEADGLVFRYAEMPDPVLRGCGLRINAGDRAVLMGASGGGKSTLAAVLAGLRTPQSGLLLAGGLDRATLGAPGWRRRVVLAPQFHQNHIITAPLFFNLILGRPGPLGASDQREVRELCDELGLGPLLEKMPGGLDQIVGETGWQLSHGERSRLFLARALLQRADLVVLDESFGALDPETLESVVACVTRRARSLLVIAHP